MRYASVVIALVLSACSAANPAFNDNPPEKEHQSDMLHIQTVAVSAVKKTKIINADIVLDAPGARGRGEEHALARSVSGIVASSNERRDCDSECGLKADGQSLLVLDPVISGSSATIDAALYWNRSDSIAAPRRAIESYTVYLEKTDGTWVVKKMRITTV